MAKEEWQVFSNVFNGKKKYRVGKQLRKDEPLHSGNIEYVCDYLDDENVAQSIADKLVVAIRNSRHCAGQSCRNKNQIK